jgi:tetratricopeptide (TPR) repeat protein
MSVNSKLFLFILPLFIFISFCSSLQGERERGIRFASSGQWDKAIELLEKYVKSNTQVMSKLEGIDKSEISDKDKAQIRDFLEALLYLLGSYLGKAGFDERKVIDYVIQMKDVDPNEEGSEKKLSEIVIQIFDFLKLDYPQALSTIYKAQRLYESIMYGKEKFLDSDEGNFQLENLGEFQTDPSKDKVLHEIKRLINSIEFLGGKILIWKVVLESKMLGHPDYYVKPKSERPPTSPSLCLILDENAPFLKKYEDVKSMSQGIIVGVTLLSYGSSEELFKQQGENYKDIIINDLLENFQDKINSTCNKYSKVFYNKITQTIQDQLTRTFQEKLTGFQDKITRITVFPESITPNPDPITGVYICPRRNFDKYFKDFFMCGVTGDVQKMAEQITKDIQFFPQNATSQIVFREPDGKFKDCEGNEIKDQDKLLTLQFFFSDKVTSGEAQIIRNEICSKNEFTNLFKRLEKLVDDLKKPLSKFKQEDLKDIRETFSNFPDPTTLPEKYLKEILEQREDPKVWKDIK